MQMAMLAKNNIEMRKKWILSGAKSYY